MEVFFIRAVFDLSFTIHLLLSVIANFYDMGFITALALFYIHKKTLKRRLEIIYFVGA